MTHVYALVSEVSSTLLWNGPSQAYVPCSFWRCKQDFERHHEHLNRDSFSQQSAWSHSPETRRPSPLGFTTHIAKGLVWRPSRADFGGRVVGLKLARAPGCSPSPPATKERGAGLCRSVCVCVYMYILYISIYIYSCNNFFCRPKEADVIEKDAG